MPFPIDPHSLVKAAAHGAIFLASPLIFARDPLPRVLMYHRVAPPSPDAGPASADSVAPVEFARQMQWLKRSGRPVLPLGDIVARLHAGRPIPLGTVAISFDDGYRCVVRHALPILRALGLPATFFTCAAHVGESEFPHLVHDRTSAREKALRPELWQPFTWEDIAEVCASGMEIGSHNLTHRSLGPMNPGERWREIHDSKIRLDTATGNPVHLYSYPFGSAVYGDHDAETRALLLDAGYRGGFTTTIGAIEEDSDPLALPRIPVEASDTPATFALKVRGAYDWMDAPKTLWQRLRPRRDRASFPVAVNDNSDAVAAHEVIAGLSTNS